MERSDPSRTFALAVQDPPSDTRAFASPEEMDPVDMEDRTHGGRSI